MHSGHIPTGALIVAGLCWMAVPPIARAADSTQSDADMLEEIIVTATKRAERALDVAASISVIGAADLERLHATSLQDLAAIAPGLLIQSGGSPGQTSIVLRGLPALSGASLVATLIDDSGVGSSTSWANEPGLELDMLPYDIERIEILRGPQGTLYGANSMGGVLKYVTKDPSLTASEAQLGGETFVIKGGGSLGAGARGSWSGPLVTGTLAVRASLYGQETPGYIRNPLRGLNHENSLSQYGGRLALLWQPVTDLKVKLQGIYQRIDSAGNANIFAQQLGTPQDAYYRPGNWLGGDLTSYPHAIPEPFSSDVKFISGTLEWHTAFADLVSVTSYSDKQVWYSIDYSSVLGYVQPLLEPNTTSTLSRFRNDVRVRRASQEIRLASPSGQRLEWLIGAYYSDENASNNQYLDALDSRLNLIPALNPFFVGYIPSTYTEVAVFGTLTYRIADQFDLTGGLRWLANRESVGQNILPGLYVPASHSLTRSAETPKTYAFGARYRPKPEAMVYLRVASGYRPGTPNLVVPGYPEITARSNSDTMVNYEVGIKSELMNRRASLALAVFKMNWSDMQLNIVTPDGRLGYVINAGKVTSEGFEIAATYWPRDAIHLAVNAAYTDAFATEAVPAAGIFLGTRLPASPRWTAAATFEYRMRDLNQWTPHLSGSWRYIAAQYSGLSTTPPVGLQPAYSWVDVDLRMTKGRYDVSLYAKNLFDKRAFNSAGPFTDNRTGASSFGGVPIQPRLVGLNVSVRL
jgi:outer membrane receptor protein involved in Fe transport